MAADTSEPLKMPLDEVVVDRALVHALHFTGDLYEWELAATPLTPEEEVVAQERMHAIRDLEDSVRSMRGKAYFRSEQMSLIREATELVSCVRTEDPKAMLTADDMNA